MQRSVQRKHRHKHKHKHKRKTEPKTKDISKENHFACLKKSLSDVFLLYFCMFLCLRLCQVKTRLYVHGRRNDFAYQQARSRYHGKIFVVHERNLFNILCRLAGKPSHKNRTKLFGESRLFFGNLDNVCFPYEQALRML